MAQITDASLPVILCLHGHGTNGSIYRYQARTVVQVLAPKFRFVFVDSPLETPQPGPGVPPFLADAKPYRRWHHDENTAGFFDLTAGDIESERRQVRDTLAGHIERDQPVGIMAFSQGTRVATALCLDHGLGANIKFVIMICGAAPLLPLATGLQPQMLNLPSIHVQGSADPWFGRAKRLVQEYFNPKCAKTIRFHTGHEVPSRLREAEQISDEVIAAYESVSRDSSVVV